MTDATNILIFARYPVAGQAKTRLIPALGPHGAARLHRRMTEYAVSVARTAARPDGLQVTLCYTGARRREFRAWLGPDLDYAAQASGDLGTRLERAFTSAFRCGTTRALAVGADVPALSADLLRQAMQALDDHDVVLGPAQDGGYYLLGMTRRHPELFADIEWGSEHTCAQTREAICRSGLTAMDLPVLNDVDRPEDLDGLRDDSRFEDVFTEQPVVSVIIPTLNEASALPATLERVRSARDVEVVVADGGSCDGTRELAERSGAAVLNVERGRAAQQNAGAAAARGRYLLFLHADTLPPIGYADLIRAALDTPSTVAGAFRFGVATQSAGMRAVRWGANLRSARLQWPYGDQGLFMERRVFDALGGFAALPIMEDVDLVRRLRRRGRVVTLSASATTSARRWQTLGVWRTTMRNQAMVVGFLAGVAPERLVRFYRNGVNSIPGRV